MTIEQSEAACTPSFSSAELERFESWFKEHGMPLAARTGYRFEDVSRRAFEAGVRAEREACAKVAESYRMTGSQMIAAEIRARSNAVANSAGACASPGREATES